MKIMITLVDDNQNDIDILMAQLNSYALKNDINFEVSAFIYKSQYKKGQIVAVKTPHFCEYLICL